MKKTSAGNEYLLRNTDSSYFRSLSPSPAYLSKLGGLRDHKPDAKTVVSVGMAGGEDLCALSRLYGDKIRLIGLDVSPIAIELARSATIAAGIDAEFIESDATNINLPEASVDGFVLSAVLHEIYSYADDGKAAFVKTIEETLSKLSENGCLFISDFAAPRIVGPVSVTPKTAYAASFIKYFTQSFRKFHSEARLTSPSESKGHIHDYGLSSEPHITNEDASVVSELLWHFKHFAKLFDSMPPESDMPSDWKEINEAYLPAHPFKNGYEAMPIDQYTATILAISDDLVPARGRSVACVSAALTPQRTEIIDMLSSHFNLTSFDSDEPSRDIILECTNWMDLVFKKI